MKKLTLFALILTTFKTARAQYRDGGGDNKKAFFSTGFDLGVPANSPFGISYGGSAKAEVKVVRQVGISLTGGYTVYNYKDAFINFSHQTINTHPAFIPLKAGLKYYSGGLYFEGNLGSAVKANDAAISNQFIYSLGLGFDAGINSYSDIDIGFRYDGYNERQYSVTGIRIAYRVGW